MWADFVKGRVCNEPSLLWVEMSSYPAPGLRFEKRNCIFKLTQNEPDDPKGSENI